MRLLRLFSVVIAVMLAFSLAACEEQGSPSAGELNSGGVVSTDFDPNAHKPKPPAEALFLNNLTALKTVKEADVNKMPVAVVISNSADTKTVHSGLVDADVVFESEFENGETLFLAVYKKAPLGVNIGPTSIGTKLFVDICQAFNFKLASNGLEAEHAEPFVVEQKIDCLNLDETGYIKLLENGASGNLQKYTDGDMLNSAISNGGYVVPDNISMIMDFISSRAPATETAGRILVKFSDTAITGFYYNEEKKVYSRGGNEAPFVEYLTNKSDDYKNVFILKTPAVKGAHCDHYEYNLQSGEGYYATEGGYEKIIWELNGIDGTFVFKDASGGPLSVNEGKSYIGIVKDSIEDSFKAE